MVINGYIHGDYIACFFSMGILMRIISIKHFQHETMVDVTYRRP